MIGAVDLAQHMIGIVGHAGKKTARRIASAWAKFTKHPRDALGLQAGELQRQRLARLTRIQKPLAAIVRASALRDIAFVDELFEDAAERLFGNFQDIEEVGDLDAGIRLTKCSTR